MPLSSRFLLFLVSWLFVACTTGAPPSEPLFELPTPANLAVIPPTPTLINQSGQPALATLPSTVEGSALPTLAPTPNALWEVAISPAVPHRLAAEMRRLLANDDRFIETAWEVGRNVHLIVVPEGERTVAAWVYVVAGSFDTVMDGVNLAQLQGAPVLWGDEATTAVFATTFPNLTSTPDPTAALWAQPDALALIPFDQLTPNLKVIALEGVNPLYPELPPSYLLTRRFGLSGDTTAVDALHTLWREANAPTTNRDETKLTRVAVTGVTALVRATAAQMESNGILWPGEEVAPILQTADIAHISNEVSFVADCPFPNAYSSSLVFCSADRYLDLLTHLGTDVVELTGNHVNDYGSAQFARTIDMYEAAGMKFFGGGRNLEEANQPALFTHNGNQIAFVGCNPAGPPGAWATASTAGSIPCGDYSQLKQQIADLHEQGYLVIATLQYPEHYDYLPMAQQKVDFRALAEAGATAVSGSQAHHTAGFGFHDNGGFIHYGPGNLFFDQMNMMGTRQTIIANYILHDGQLLSVDLWTGLIENYARPRLMTPDERAAFLQTLFNASDW